MFIAFEVKGVGEETGVEVSDAEQHCADDGEIGDRQWFRCNSTSIREATKLLVPNFVESRGPQELFPRLLFPTKWSQTGNNMYIIYRAQNTGRRALLLWVEIALEIETRSMADKPGAGHWFSPERFPHSEWRRRRRQGLDI